MNYLLFARRAFQAPTYRLLQHYKGPYILLLLSMVMVLFSVPANAGDNKKNILVLHSYHKGYQWTDDITSGIEQVFSSSELQLNVRYEYMDSKKNFDEIYLKQMGEWYRYKYRNTRFDVIISSDDNAFNFLRDYRDRLFPETPVLYCGTNYMTPKRAAELPNSTGINEAASLKGNIELILKMYPQVSQLVIVSDLTTTGVIVSQQIEKILPEFLDRVEFVILQNLTKEELVTELNSLPETAVILYTVFFRDREGNFYEYDDSINIVTTASSVPVHVTWDFSMGNGAIGGLLTSGIAQGKAVARIALQVLRGEHAYDIPYVRESPNKYIFDYKALNRFGIDSHLLPANSFIKNQPDELYEKYKKLIWESVGAAAVLTLIILLLINNILRRKRAEVMLIQANEELEERVLFRTQDLSSSNAALTKSNKALIDSEERYHSLSDAAFEGILLIKKGIIIEANEMFCVMLGYHPSELINTPAIDLIPPEDRKNVEMKILTGYAKPYETKCLKKDSTIFPVEVHSKVFSYKDEPVRVTAIRDLTEKKKAEEEILALQGIIPICMHCKEIRDDKGYWNKLEHYISEHYEAEFSHSICDNCLEKYYPEDDD